jgi:hypothetical protein
MLDLAFGAYGLDPAHDTLIDDFEGSMRLNKHGNNSILMNVVTKSTWILGLVIYVPRITPLQARNKPLSLTIPSHPTNTPSPNTISTIRSRTSWLDNIPKCPLPQLRHPRPVRPNKLLLRPLSIVRRQNRHMNCITDMWT